MKELEQIFAAKLIVKPSGFLELNPDLGPEAFCDQEARAVFEAVAAATTACEIAQLDAVALAQRALDRVGSKAQAATWLDTLIGRMRTHGDPKTLREIGDRLHLEHRRRRTAESLKRALAEVYKSADPESTVNEAVAEVQLQHKTNTAETLRQTVAAAHAAWQRRLEGERDPGLKVGFETIDRMVRFGPGQLHILAARPGGGKTTLAVNIAQNVAASGIGVLIHSLEMSRQELLHKMVMRCTAARTEEGLVQDAYGYLDGLPIWISGEQMLHRMLSLTALTMAQAQAHKIGLVIVDYLQLVQTQNQERTKRYQAIGEVTRSLKAFARKHQAPILALSAMNRAIEQGTSARWPMLSDLRESGDIEADADSVMFLHRPDAQNQPNDLRFIAAKNRFGPLGMNRLQADFAASQIIDPDNPTTRTNT